MAINKPRFVERPMGARRTASASGWGFGFPRSAGSADNKTHPDIPAHNGRICPKATRAVTGAERIALKVADNFAHLRQPFINQFRRRDFGYMVVAFGEHPERSKGIGIQALAGRNSFLGKGIDVVLGDLADGFHGGKARLAVIVIRQGLPESRC